ncbi:beta-N-acetylhexosaminidase [Propionicimonas paludicola]|uniref:Beta-N-acetylhexosaminidase n=1 Tax=Propionicimonas paludicola TaxID=185243 RepID=A0A2A9CMK3_9ACTN|nr:glycoside hydrolase family 3 N-terminal domain-containing protein [Propionicimonas paludicola]PFG15548.1 beta-N-acetylhexosaminidase [Propionicimonas paludicola]
MIDELRRAINTTLMPGFDGPVAPQWLLKALADGLGSVCLFDSNVVDPDQLVALTTAIHAANPSALIAMDEEGGDVTRLHHRQGSPHPSAAYLGARDSIRVTEQVAAQIGAELLAAGVDLNLAPVADANTNPLNPVIGVRSFGTDPQLVARHVAAYVAGLQALGVAACAKHFPGHGDTSADSHRELPTITVDRDLLWSRELVPFRAAVEAGAQAVMTSHILVPSIDPQWPATLSAPILGLLRDELGFTGLIVSDALDMAGASAGRGIAEAAVLALSAGADLLCIGAGNTGDQMIGIREHVAAAVRDGRLSEARVFEAANRATGLVAGLAAQRWTNAANPLVRDVADGVTIDPAVFARRRPIAALTAPLFLLLDTEANIAAGQTPWGIGAQLADEVAGRLPGSGFATAGDLGELAAVLAAHPNRIVVAQGKDFHRVEFLRAAAVMLRGRTTETILVEEGWPTPGGEPAVDLISYGSGRGTMLALLDLLAGGTD